MTRTVCRGSVRGSMGGSAAVGTSWDRAEASGVMQDEMIGSERCGV
ncbi:MAG: hypothetical protein ACLTKE_14630 [Coprococcus sp.]